MKKRNGKIRLRKINKPIYKSGCHCPPSNEIPACNPPPVLRGLEWLQDLYPPSPPVVMPIMGFVKNEDIMKFADGTSRIIGPINWSDGSVTPAGL